MPEDDIDELSGSVPAFPAQCQRKKSPEPVWGSGDRLAIVKPPYLIRQMRWRRGRSVATVYFGTRRFGRAELAGFEPT